MPRATLWLEEAIGPMQTRTVGFVLLFVVAAGFAVAPACSQKDPSTRPVPIEVPTFPEDRLPDRVLLDTRVTLDITGTVVDAVAGIATGAGRDWLLGVAPGAELAETPFVAADEPAWAALDRLREAFGYDWGLVEGTIVCWPALLPRGERATPGPPRAEQRERREPGDALSFPEPTELRLVLTRAREAGALRGIFVYPHPELMGWRVAGSLARPDRNQLRAALGAAIGATADGVGCHYRLVVGSPRRLDAAIRLLDTDPALAGLRGDELRSAFRRSVLPLLCAQQWAVIATGHRAAELALRELPVEVAAMAVATVRECAPGHEDEFVPDWASPGRIKVCVRSTSGFRQAGDGWAPTWMLGVAVEVPATNGLRIQM